MKHLKSFNESVTENDIYLELKDMGFDVWVARGYAQYNTANSETWDYFVRITMKKMNQFGDKYMIGFEYNQVKEVVERVKDYLRSVGYDCKIKIFNPGICKEDSLKEPSLVVEIRSMKKKNIFRRLIGK